MSGVNPHFLAQKPHFSVRQHKIILQADSGTFHDPRHLREQHASELIFESL
jgi:hypothetical protein